MRVEENTVEDTALAALVGVHGVEDAGVDKEQVSLPEGDFLPGDVVVQTARGRIGQLKHGVPVPGGTAVDVLVDVHFHGQKGQPRSLRGPAALPGAHWWRRCFE